MALRRPPRPPRGTLLGLLVAIAWISCEPDATTETSARGLLRGTLEAPAGGAPLGALHDWQLDLEWPDGRAVAEARVQASGGMPEHDHGLPTQPRVAAGGRPGAYRVQGVRFHMPGRWQLVFDVEVDGERDLLTFALRVE